FHRDVYDAAINAATHAVELDPRLARAWYIRAASRASTGDRVGALSDYDRAIELDPKSGILRADRGAARLAQGDAAAALADFDAAVQLEPDYVRGWIKRAQLHGRRGAAVLDGALADATKALELDPRNGPAIFWRASALERKGDKAAAIRAFQSILEIDPVNLGAQARERLAALQK